MRKIEFIAPVEAMRGNLSGEQNLKYPTNDNSAWNAPSAKTSYARNYRPSYIGARKTNAQGSKVYFAVKTKQAVKMSPAVRLNMALLAAGKVIADSLRQDLTVLTQLQNYWLDSADFKLNNWTFQHWLSFYCRSGLSSKSDIFYNSPGKTSIIIANPFISQHITGAHEIEISQDVLVKFWDVLSLHGISFNVMSYTGIAFLTEKFEELVESDHNVLSLTLEEEPGEVQHVLFGSMWLAYKDEGTTVEVAAGDTIVAGRQYILKTPE